MKSQITNTSSEITLPGFLKRNNRFFLLKTIHPTEELKQLKDVAIGNILFTECLFIN